MEVGVDGIVQEVEDGALLLGAGGHRRPDAFAPLAAPCTARALGDVAVYLRRRRACSSKSALILVAIAALLIGCARQAGYPDRPIILLCPWAVSTQMTSTPAATSSPMRS